MLSHELMEVREIGEKIKEVAKTETPTLVKYAEAVPYLIETVSEFSMTPPPFPLSDGDVIAEDWCTLISYDAEGEQKVLAAALFRFGEMSYAEALGYVKALQEPEQAKLAQSLLGRLSKYDVPLRELEYSTYLFDLVMDQGAYAEFKRHRLMSQTPQRLTTRLGYATPRLITESGFESRYDAAMQSASQMFDKLCAVSPGTAQYVVPNGFNRRVLAEFNLREAFAFCQLRSASNAHFSIRRVAQRVYEEINRVHPLLTKYMKLNEETWQGVEENYFTVLQ
jgi:hypothetical protein